MTTIDFGPAVDAKNATLLRNALVKRTIYAIADNETATALVANTSGQVPIGMAFGGIVFWLDATDATSAHDGISVLVTSDGYRYHASDFIRPYAVLSYNTAAPPVSPAIGDAYLTSAAPAGAWAGYPSQIAVWTRRGWVFIQPAVGDLIYVRNGTNDWVYLDEAGNIVSRFLNTPDSIRDLTLIGGQRRYHIQSQTVNAPPVSPALGLYWVVGPAPTGAWAGQTAKIATSYDGATWTFIAPDDGLEAFDRAIKSNFIYRTGLGWVGAAGAWTALSMVRTDSGSMTHVNTGTFWTDTATPATTMRRVTDDATLDHRSALAGARLRVRYGADSTGWGSWSGDPVALALFRDSEANAIAWSHFESFATTGTGPRHARAEWIIDTPDAAMHTYKVAIMQGSGSIPPTTWRRRHFTIEEAF